MHGKILIVDDDQSMCEMLEVDLRRRGFLPTWYTSPDEALSLPQDDDIDVLLTDLNLPGINGIELCKRFLIKRPDVPVIVITAFGSMETAIAAIRAGAYDFVTKPIDTDFLSLTLERAVNHRALKEKVKSLSASLKQTQQYNELIGNSSPMRDLFSLLTRVADVDTSVLIIGETGTGKELTARALHRKSQRKDQPFVTVNCAALPENLLESELFGHLKGAFTDAKTERKGLFRQAEGGVLFFDEIGDFPLSLQPKLFRVLEERCLRPVGSELEIPFNVRIVAATNRDLESAMDEGNFREELFYRLNVIKIILPPLRDRGTDILLLCQHFVEQFAARFNKQVSGIVKPAAEKLLAYSWPGNVRELKNTMERAVALTQFEKIIVEDLPGKIRSHRNSHVFVGGENPAELVSLNDIERRYILHVLKTVRNNRTAAARILGLDRKTLYRKLQHYDVKL